MDQNRELIEFINKLQSYSWTGCKIDVQLPQIVVVGAQSSGKSSVLEGLIGAPILPRGTGTVTRRPIIVQLINTTNKNEIGVEIQGDSAARTENCDIIREKINGKMHENNGAIVDMPIIVRVFSPNVVTLTVVDLPGIKRLASAGEPSDLERRITELCRKYIRQENAIILAVSPANYDISNSDGLVLAREADPYGKRTIGVLTKLDLMDKGTDSRDLLMGKLKDYEIKLGMIGLVNRSQEDLAKNLSLEEQLIKEKQFLMEKYPDLAMKNGMTFLRKRLQELLVPHISKCLPDILRKMKAQLEDSEKNLASIPDAEAAEDKKTVMNRAICRFEANVRKELEGSVKNPEVKHLHGGVKVKTIFVKEFLEDMDKAGRGADASISEDDIYTAFQNSDSYNSLFKNPEGAFRKLVQNRISNLEKPGLECARKVYKEMEAVANRSLCKVPELAHFPDLRNAIKSVFMKMMDARLDSLMEAIKDYIRVHASIVISLDPGLLKSLENVRFELVRPGSMAHAQPLSLPSGMTSPIQQATEELRRIQFGQQQPQQPFTFGAVNGAPRHPPSAGSSIVTLKEIVMDYFNHIKSHCADYVPKLITDRLIEQFSNGGSLDEELRIKIFENYNELVRLPASARAEKKNILEWKSRLEKSIADVKSILENNPHLGDDGTDSIAKMN